MIKLITRALLAALIVASPAVADQMLPNPQIDTSGTVKFRGGPTLGRMIGGTYVPTAPTQGANDNSDKVATTAYVDGTRPEVQLFADKTGTISAVTALQAAINACPAAGCTIKVPRGDYKIDAQITLKSGVTLTGAGQAAGYGGRTRLYRSGNNPMFLIPGTTNLSPGIATSITIADLQLDGTNVDQPVLYSPEVSLGRGSWNTTIRNVTFSNARPAIQAANGWDWWVTNSAFINCGHMAGALNPPQQACIYIQSSAQNQPWAASNSWRITDNFIDTSVGRGIISESSSGGTQPNTYMSIKGNHFGVQGYESFYGCLRTSVFEGNLSEGSIAGYPILHLLKDNFCGSNVISNNIFGAAGTYGIVADGIGDLIHGNMFYIQGSGDAHIIFGAGSANNRAFNNKTSDNPCCNTKPLVLDYGTLNTVAFNDGPDGAVSGGYIPYKQFGTSYKIPTEGSYLKPALSTVASLPACNSGAAGQIRMVYDAASPTLGGALNGGGVSWVLAACNGFAWTIP